MGRIRGASVFCALLIVALGMSCHALEYDFSGYMPDPGESDHYLVYHIRPAGVQSPTYHQSVFFVADLLSRTRGVIPGSGGYYLSRSKYSPGGVRLTVFLKGADSSRKVTEWITALSDAKTVRIVPYVTILDEESVMTKHYEGSEQSFRKYLCLYTPIMVECMQHDFDRTQAEAKSLMEHGGMDIELLESSRYFRSLAYDARSEFIRALYYNRKWTHMVINFILGYDEE